MKLRLATSFAALLLVLPAPGAAQDASDAYVNEEARELVRRARMRRDSVDRRIEAYSTTARERFSVALRAGIAEKLVYRRETATHIDWERDGPVRMNVLGMREVAPMFNAKPEVPGDISAELLRLSFDPVGTDMFLRVDTVALRHPLADNGEAHYRYEAGGSTVVALPDGRSVRLRELRVIPRRRLLTLMSGSLWLEEATHAVVQVYIRLASNFDADRNGSNVTVAQAQTEDGDSTKTRAITLRSLPGFVKPVRAEIDYIAIDFGLYDMHWWLPRSLAAQGHVQVSGMRIPMSYERTYEGYEVRGDTAGPFAPAPPRPRRCLDVVTYVSTAGTPEDSARVENINSERARRAKIEEASRAERGDTVDTSCTREFILSAPSDSALLHSAELPESPYESDMTLISESELEAIADRVRRLPLPDVDPDARFQWGLNGPGLVRYNRVEGLSLGARLFTELPGGRLMAEARLGSADLEPRGELAWERNGESLFIRPAAYRRLLPTHPNDRLPGLFGSLGALLLGRDDDHYFDAIGGEILLRPAEARRQWYDLRLYAERQSDVEVNTDFSLLHLINSNNAFPGNFIADDADQLGARLRLRGSLGRNPAAPRIAGELSLGAETGDFRILRPEALVRVELPVSMMLLGLEGAAGTVEGSTIPAQAFWRLGGSSTLRGYSGGAIAGERFWRGRGELAWGLPAVRLSLFSDVGWAGPRTRFDADGALYSVGVGGSFADGLVRLDLARAMVAPKGWRVHLHFGGI